MLNSMQVGVLMSTKKVYRKCFILTFFSYPLAAIISLIFQLINNLILFLTKGQVDLFYGGSLMYFFISINLISFFMILTQRSQEKEN